MNELESIVVEQTGLSREKVQDLLEGIFTYIQGSLSRSAAAEVDQLIPLLRPQADGDLFNEARNTFFGAPAAPSGLKN